MSMSRCHNSQDKLYTASMDVGVPNMTDDTAHPFDLIMRLDGHINQILKSICVFVSAWYWITNQQQVKSKHSCCWSQTSYCKHPKNWDTYNWASSWDYGTYHICDQQRLRPEPAHVRSLATAFAVRSHELRKWTKGQTSSTTGWLHMRIWRMNLLRTKSAKISQVGSIKAVSP